MPSSSNSDNPAVDKRPVCQTCGGDGYLVDQNNRDSVCLTCEGVGFYVPFGSRILYWKKQLARREVAGEKLARVVRGIIDGALICLGIVGFGFGFWNLYDLIQDGRLIGEFWSLRNTGMAVFWISLTADCYAYYRISRERHPRKSLTKQTPMELKASLAGSFDSLGSSDALENVANLLSFELERVLQTAWNIANKLNHREINPSHIFAALLSSQDAALIFARLGLSHKTLSERVVRFFSGLPQDQAGEPRLGRVTKELFFTAYREAYQTGRSQIDIPEILVALATTEPRTQALLDDLNVTELKLRNVVAWVHISEELRAQYHRFRSRSAWRPKHGMNRAMTAQETRLLNRFSHDLTELARSGALPLTVGREQELHELYRVFERGGNPILVGQPGVGKTALINGIAQRMAAEDVPDILKDKRLVSLSVPALVSGAKDTGVLEERLSMIINELSRSGNVILFIDNIQNLIGISSSGGENFDLSDVLAQAISGGVLQVIATSNPIDYRRYIENKSSIAGVLTRVDCDEVDTNGAILILESKVGAVEYHHNVFFTYDALESTVTYAQRYIHERYLPEKAIMLLEEVAVDVQKKRGKHAFVQAEDVARIVSEKTRIQVTKVTATESDKLMNLESIMHQRMVGQDEAVQAVAASLRRARAELRDPKRPIANFLFLGPTGGGKTELAKTVAEAYFGSEDTMIRVDMSEYQEQSSIYRLIGSPPGSGNVASGGYLTEAVRSRPFALILLDEIEKAHPNILNVFLQVMDDGRLTDGTGRTVDFTNSIIIATSNAGTEFIQNRMKEGATVETVRTELIASQLNQYFRPEFLNRFDRIIVFRPLTRTEILEIVKLMLAKVAHQLQDRGISFVASNEAIQELADIGYDPTFGARPLRRAIQERVDNALANYLLQGQLSRRDTAVLEAGGVIRVERAEPV
jgi:ATP-dependent Clp protease ATP-binding subunit ClpC